MSALQIFHQALNLDEAKQSFPSCDVFLSQNKEVVKLNKGLSEGRCDRQRRCSHWDKELLREMEALFMGPVPLMGRVLQKASVVSSFSPVEP